MVRTAEGVDHGRHRFRVREVRRRLPRRRRIDTDERRRPGAYGHDGRAGEHVAGLDTRVRLLDRRDSRALPHLEPGGESREHLVGVRDAAVGLVQAALAGLESDAEATVDLGRVEHLGGDAARVQRVAVRLPATEVERAVQLEELLAGLRLELPPERVGLLREPDPLDGGIRQPDDPRATVARAALVTELELLQHEHVSSGSGESAGGREPHDARADDDDLGVDATHPGPRPARPT